MRGKFAFALIGIAAGAASAAAHQASESWADMSTGASTRVLVDTASITSQGTSRSADALIISSGGRQAVRLQLDCPNRKYRVGEGDWQSDDPANVRRICERDFGGLHLYSTAETEAMRPLPRVAAAAAAPAGHWVLVDWTMEQMVLLDPRSIAPEPNGWRFKILHQGAGREKPTEMNLLAHCPSKRIMTDGQELKDGDLLGFLFTNLALVGSTVQAIFVWTMCEETAAREGAPTIDLTTAIAARAKFEADRSSYLRANPGADISNAITIAPGPKEHGGYQLSLVDIEIPSGLRSEVVGKERRRTVVQQTWKHPFSAVGRLLTKTGEGGSQCTATLVGNSRTILTAKHCANGPEAEYRFTPGNSKWETGIPARIVASGDYIVIPGEKTLDAGPDSEPNTDWDDWMVLELERPAPGLPLAIPTKAFIENTISRFRMPYFHVAGFPADVKDGDEMIYSRGCGTAISDADYKGARTSKTSCASYGGSSGSALLVLTPEFRYVPVGVLSGGSLFDDTTFSILVVGSRAFDALRSKMATDCQILPPGVKFHPDACATR